MRDRVYELDVEAEAAVERLCEHGGVAVVDDERAARPPTGDLFMQVRERGFTIHAPAMARDSMAPASEVGPALEGELEDTPEGTRLTLRLRRLAPTKSQTAKLAATAVITVIALASMVASGALGHAMLLGLVVASLLAIPVAIARFRNRRRILELYAVGERALGPVAHVAIDAPYRKGALPPAR